jgi:adenine-specific DNA-methyltransferase
MQNLKMHTKNKVDENVEKIAKLFPNTLTEVIKGRNDDGTPIIEKAIDFDILKQELSSVVVEGKEERYQFTWPDKKKSILLANAPIAKTLRPCREESVDFDKTENLYIEGDNLDVLKLLQETYLNKVKMIYIDPPYNTGSDFVYEDNFDIASEYYKANSGQLDDEGNRLVQNMESNGRFHTDWLNMIYPRLKLAKDLLSDDGVIFISIDDNEVENLKKICNEVFGEINRLVNAIWVSGRTSAAHFTNSHEFVLGYAKNISSLPLFKYIGEDAIISDRTIKKPGSKNPISNITFPAGIDFECENKVFPSRFGSNEPIEIVEGIFECYNNKLKNPVTIRSAWAMKDMIETWLRGKIVVDQKGQTVNRFFFKSNGVLQYEKKKGTIHPNSVIASVTTKAGSSEVDSLIGISTFSFPKPTDLIKYFSVMVMPNDIVLDFFSGSATTAHAVMQLNAEDGGNRKFIMVQLPEETDEKSEAFKAGYKNICEIGKERIRRAGEKIKKQIEQANSQVKLGEEPKKVPDIGFRVLKVDSTNMKDVYYNPSEYTQAMLDGLQDNIKNGRTPEDLLFQVMLDLGVLLSSDIKETEICDKKVFSVMDNYLIACFDNNVSNEVVTEIAKLQPYYAVFRDSSIATDSVATNFEQIFETYSKTTVRKVL